MTSAALTARPTAVRAADALWRFARPHTIIGTALSIVGALRHRGRARTPTGAAPGTSLATLIAGLAVNVAIVGVNQLTDVEIDRVNKPYLPMAAGDLSPSRARGASSPPARVVPLAMALTQGAAETAAVAAGLAVGALYSLPPIRLKRFPVAASLCITGVRSLVVNLGVYWHFAHQHRPAGVGAVPVRAAVQLRDRGAQGRPGHRGRPPLRDPHVQRPRSARSGSSRIGLGALALAYAGMAVAGPIALRGHVQPALLVAGQAGSRDPARRLGQGRRPDRPGVLHPLLHARLGTVLPAVRARAAGLPRVLTTWTIGPAVLSRVRHGGVDTRCPVQYGPHRCRSPPTRSGRVVSRARRRRA